MTKRSKKQEVIAEEAMEQQERQALLRQIRLLKRLPKDFRDLDPGSPDWEAFANVTGRRKEMEAWSGGPILCLAPLNKAEALVFRGEKVIDGTTYGEVWEKNFFRFLGYTEALEVSWLYLPDEETPVITALNLLLSRFGAGFRVKGQLLSERTGHPIGVVH